MASTLGGCCCETPCEPKPAPFKIANTVVTEIMPGETATFTTTLSEFYLSYVLESQGVGGNPAPTEDIAADLMMGGYLYRVYAVSDPFLGATVYAETQDTLTGGSRVLKFGSNGRMNPMYWCRFFEQYQYWDQGFGVIPLDAGTDVFTIKNTMQNDKLVIVSSEITDNVGRECIACNYSPCAEIDTSTVGSGSVSLDVSGLPSGAVVKMVRLFTTLNGNDTSFSITVGNDTYAVEAKVCTHFFTSPTREEDRLIFFITKNGGPSTILDGVVANPANPNGETVVFQLSQCIKDGVSYVVANIAGAGGGGIRVGFPVSSLNGDASAQSDGPNGQDGTNILLYADLFGPLSVGHDCSQECTEYEYNVVEGQQWYPIPFDCD